MTRQRQGLSYLYSKVIINAVEKVSIAKTLAPAVTDKQHRHLILDQLSFSSSKLEVNERLDAAHCKHMIVYATFFKEKFATIFSTCMNTNSHVSIQ